MGCGCGVVEESGGKTGWNPGHMVRLLPGARGGKKERGMGVGVGGRVPDPGTIPCFSFIRFYLDLLIYVGMAIIFKSEINEWRK